MPGRLGRDGGRHLTGPQLRRVIMLLLTPMALIVTAAGRGSRLAPITSVIPKPFLPVAVGADGLPEAALPRLLRQFQAVGAGPVWIAATEHPWFGWLGGRCPQVTVVVAPALGEWSAVAACLDSGPPAGSTIVVSGDNVFVDDDVLAFGRSCASAGEGCLVAVAPRPSTKDLTWVSTDGDRVRELVEKPPDGRAGLAKAGLYYFGPRALRAAAATPERIDRFGEQSMTEILRALLDAGVDVTCHRLRHGFHDVGSLEGLAGVIHDSDMNPSKESTWTGQR